MFERCFIKILDCIKDLNGNSKLKDLGDKINDMLADPEARKQKYGYAGLEGIYINENILGLLEVLSEKIQLNRNEEKKQDNKMSSVMAKSVLSPTFDRIPVERKIKRIIFQRCLCADRKTQISII